MVLTPSLPVPRLILDLGLRLSPGPRPPRGSMSSETFAHVPSQLPVAYSHLTVTCELSHMEGLTPTMTLLTCIITGDRLLP